MEHNIMEQSNRKQNSMKPDNRKQETIKQEKLKQEKSGLVLEGGGMRGIYTAGVLDVMMEEGIAFDGVIGVSAGAIHGCSFVSGQNGRSIRYYEKYCNDKRFMSLSNVFRTGDLIDAQFCYHDLPERLDPYDYKAFNKSRTEFYVTCSNLETGKAEYLRITDMKKQIDMVRASASLPYVSRIVEFEGRKYLDGGCCDSIPVLAFREMGFTKTVVVLTRPETYVKQPESTWMAKLRYWKYPRFIKALKNRHRRYNQTVCQMKELEDGGDIFVIRPENAIPIERTEKDPVRLREAYCMGRRDGKNQMEALKAWLSKEGKEVKETKEAGQNHGTEQ